MSQIQEVRIQSKVDTKDAWENSPLILLNQEVGYEKETGKYKIGDGIHVWSELEYANKLPLQEGNADNALVHGYTLTNWNPAGDDDTGINDQVVEYIQGNKTNSNYVGIKTIEENGVKKIAAGAFGENSVTFGTKSQALGGKSFSEGSKTIAFDNNSHAEGNGTFAVGKHSHAEGNGTTSIGNASHAEGFSTIAKKPSSHAEGHETIAEGDRSHAEGYVTLAKGDNSHAEGFGTIAQNTDAHAEGLYTITGGGIQHVQGKWNEVMGGDYAHVVGNGVSEDVVDEEGNIIIRNRSNAHTLDWDGNAWFAGKLELGEDLDNLLTIEHGEGKDSLQQPSSKALSDNAIALGKDNISGLKGFYIKSIDTTNKKIYLSLTKAEPFISNDDNTDPFFETPSYTRGKWFSLIVRDKLDQRNHYHLCSTIQDIQNNVISYKNDLPFNTIFHESDLRTPVFFVPTQPEVGNILISYGSYSEGYENISAGNYAHTEGRQNLATGDYSHAEGRYTTAGYGAHAEGEHTVAEGYGSHAEGYKAYAKGDYSHSQGNETIAFEKYSHAEGNGSKAEGESSHAEGNGSIAKGSYSHAEGNGSKAEGGSSHAEGNGSNAEGNYSHAEGDYTKATGSCSHAEGGSTKAIGQRAHAEGNGSVAEGNYSHAEGSNTEAIGDCSHAEGINCKATGKDSHAEGNNTQASGYRTHAEGFETVAKNTNSHAEGYQTVTGGDNQHVQGKWNKEMGASYAHIVGNGSNNDNRTNAHTLDWSGNAWFAGDVYVGPDNKKLLTNLYEGNANNTLIHGRTLTNWNIYGDDNTGINNKVVEYIDQNKENENDLPIQIQIIKEEDVEIRKVVAGAFGENSVAFGSKSQALGGKSFAEGSKTIAFGNNTHAEGNGTFAVGPHSHSEGSGTTSIGNSSHAEGRNSIAKGDNSHAEGLGTHSQGDNSHAEGCGTQSTGSRSHAEGFNTTARNDDSHAEGLGTITGGGAQHVQGKWNEAMGGNYAHVVGNGSDEHHRTNAHTLDWKGNAWFAGEVTIGSNNTKLVSETELASLKIPLKSGDASNSLVQGDSVSNWNPNNSEANTKIVEYTTNRTVNENGLAIQIDDEGKIIAGAFGSGSVAFGTKAQALGGKSFAEGSKTVAFANNSHAEGNSTFAVDQNTHAEGYKTTALGYNSHAEGKDTIAQGKNSHAEGNTTEAIGDNAHAEGYNTDAIGENSHAEGMLSKSTQKYSHAEGYNTQTQGECAHSEGKDTIAKGYNSHAEGNTTEAIGENTHAEGYRTQALGYMSHTEGQGTISQGRSQHVQGEYNIIDNDVGSTWSPYTYRSKYAHIVGNGTDDNNRSNAHTLDWEGNAWFAGTVTAEGIALPTFKVTLNTPTLQMQGYYYYDLFQYIDTKYRDVTKYDLQVELAPLTIENNSSINDYLQMKEAFNNAEFIGAQTQEKTYVLIVTGSVPTISITLEIKAVKK